MCNQQRMYSQSAIDSVVFEIYHTKKTSSRTTNKQLIAAWSEGAAVTITPILQQDSQIFTILTHRIVIFFLSFVLYQNNKRQQRKKFHRRQHSKNIHHDFCDHNDDTAADTDSSEKKSTITASAITVEEEKNK